MFMILREQDLLSHPENLSAAWDSSSSVAIAPKISPVDETWISEQLGKLPESLQSGHFAILTSGSTGLPKLVVGSKTRAEELVNQIHVRQKLDPVEAAVLTLPLSYSYSLVNQWLWAKKKKREFIPTLGLSEPATLFDKLRSAGDSMLCLVGSMIPVLRRFLSDNDSFPNVSRVNFAGGPFPQGELAWLYAVFPNAEIYHNYGCTEALPRLTIRHERESRDPMELGAPVEGAEFRIDESGMLSFRSPYSAVVICDNHGSRKIQSDEWIDTGDKAETADNGRIRLLGRASEVFKRHGEKISLSLLASSLREVWTGGLIFYTEAATDGEVGHVLVLSPLPSAREKKELLLHLRKHFRRPFWPIRMEAVSQIPLSANGKPDLRLLEQLPRELIWKQLL